MTPTSVPAACDVLVVGGGINGCGIARDLAGRGWRVALCERDDLASHTSSASTKLVHGGLRYLEHGEFGLVRKALVERGRLLRAAPHIAWPLRFVMPHDAALRPAWLLRAGLFLYDHLARRDILPASRRIALRRHPAGAPLRERFATGYAYSDGWVDDARLVALCAVDAATRGAAVLVRTSCERAERGAAGWTATLRGEDGATQRVEARALVNAAGPWAGDFLRDCAGVAHAPALRLVKGSHIVVRRRLGDAAHAYLFQTDDRRVVFAIPYEGDFTLVGTTDVELRGGDPGAATIDAAEIDYLCAQANRYLAEPIGAGDVAWSYSGVRPLIGGDAGAAASELTRDWRLELDTGGGAPLLSVWGGKITTFRRLAEEAADLLAGPLGAVAGVAGAAPGGSAWTADAPLPGGDLRDWIGTPGARPDDDFARFARVLQERHPGLPPALLHGWARRYGSRVALLLEGGAPGAEVAPGVHEAELAYLRDHEFARRADDVLWRRTKHGLRLDAAGRARVETWWASHGAAAVAGGTVEDRQ